MEREKINNAVKELNNLTYSEDGKEVNYLKKKIATVAVKQQVLIIDFLNACESIPEEVEDKYPLPDSITDIYNELIDNDPRVAPPSPEKEEEETMVKAKATPAARTTGKAKPATTAAKATEEKATGKAPKKEMGKNKYGHVLGALSAQIDAYLEKGGTVSDIAFDLKTTKTRVSSHIHHLITERKIKVNNKDGVYKIAETGVAA